MVSSHKRLTGKRLNLLLDKDADYNGLNFSALGLFVALGHPLSNWPKWLNTHFTENPLLILFSGGDAGCYNNYVAAGNVFRISYAHAMHIAATDKTRQSARVGFQMRVVHMEYGTLIRYFLKCHSDYYREYADGYLKRKFESYDGTISGFLRVLADEINVEEDAHEYYMNYPYAEWGSHLNSD